MRKTKKHIVFAFIAILIAALAFGYAYLTTTLTISGITDIDRNSWDVYFDNVQVTDGSVTGVQEIEAPTITSDTEVEFHVNLKKPGDFYEFTIEARNDGTIDAMIETVEKKLNGTVITTLPSYLDYTVTYVDGIEIEDNHLLAAESLETYKVRVEYKKDINPSDLPSNAQVLELSFGVEYLQSDSNAVERNRYIYSNSTDYVLNDEISLEDQYNFSTPSEAYANSNLDFCYRFLVENGRISEMAIEYSRNNNEYYLIGLANETSLTDKPIYNSNKNMLSQSFNADEDCSEYNGTYSCGNTTYIGYARQNGEVYYGLNSYWDGQYWEPPLVAIIQANGYLYFGLDN